MRLIAALLLGAGLAAAAGAAPTPPPAFEAEYAVERGSLRLGRMVMRLTREADRLRFVTETRATGIAALILGKSMIREESVLASGEQGLEAVAYAYESTVRRKQRELEGRFLDGAGGVVELREADRRYRLAVPAGTVDRLGLHLVLGKLLAEGRERGTVQIVDLDRPKTLEYAVIGRETVETGLGSRQALRVRRIEAGRNRVTESWYAPALHYLPVRIEQRKDDEPANRLVLESLRYLEPG